MVQGECFRTAWPCTPDSSSGGKFLHLAKGAHVPRPGDARQGAESSVTDGPPAAFTLTVGEAGGLCMGVRSGELAGLGGGEWVSFSIPAFMWEKDRMGKE